MVRFANIYTLLNKYGSLKSSSIEYLGRDSFVSLIDALLELHKIKNSMSKYHEDLVDDAEDPGDGVEALVDDGEALNALKKH